MGLDQYLVWVGRPSIDEVQRWEGKNISNKSIMMNYVDVEDLGEPCKNIKDKMIQCDVLENETDWDAIKRDCGVPIDSKICGIGNNTVSFGEAMNKPGVQTFYANTYDPRYRIVVPHTVCFYKSDDIYYWRKNYEIQEIFNKAYPDVYNDYDDSHGIINCCYYPVTEDLLHKMYKVDPIFKDEFEYKYDGDIRNVFYYGYW